MPEEDAVTEPTPDVVTTEETPADEPKAPTAEDISRLQAALDKERDARKAAEKAAKDFQQQQRASMDETQRALLEAEERGANNVRSEYGKRLAQTEFRAAAAARNPEADVAKALKYLDLGTFLGDDGEPDVKAITAAVADLIPVSGAPQPPSFDGGARQSAQGGVSMSDLIRQAAGRG